jgi:hypothetical protein
MNFINKVFSNSFILIINYIKYYHFFQLRDNL